MYLCPIDDNEGGLVGQLKVKNVLSWCNQLADELLSPGKLLRTFPPLDAKKIVMLSVGLVPRIPEDLYQELVYHTQ